MSSTGSAGVAHAPSLAPAPCLAPPPAEPPRLLQVPRGAWDVHAHVIGDTAAMVPQRAYTPPAASVAQYLAMLDRVGIDFGVLVQISVHGFDNSLLLDALRRHPDRLRGVAVIRPDAPDRELRELKEAGVVGIRVNEHFAGGSSADQLEVLSRRCIELGWHVNLALHADRLRELAPRLTRLGVRMVVDHIGYGQASKGVQHPDFQALLSLLRDSDTWVKLTCAYRISDLEPPYADTQPLVRALLAAAPERLVWGSDWPHVALREPARMPQVGSLLDTLHTQLKDPVTEQAVLVGNPWRLYGADMPERGKTI